ncbi:MAG: alpha/beta hydrolase [Clostridia bacterium]|nr:alpha/beta hydrolase [Clostridia bacterium]
MEIFFVILGLMAVIAVIVLTIVYICFRMAFYAPRKKAADSDEISLPKGSIYHPFHDSMRKWALQTRAAPHKDFCITSFDGLTLYGKYYEYSPDAPIEIMFHGYRGNAERDLSGGMQRCFKLKRNALIVDQRCSGRSEGNVISFGINEHRDCLGWVDFVVNTFGKDVKIILTGISMGAATVLMAAGKPLPPNVVGVLADCGYSSPREIIMKVMRDMKLPPKLCYPFVKLGAKVFGHFDLEEYSPCEAVAHCKVPVIFFHGDDDRFVPCQMSKVNFDACKSRKKLVTVKGAGHGMCCLMDPDTYYSSLEEFFSGI